MGLRYEKRLKAKLDKLQAENKRLLKCESDLRKIYEIEKLAVKEANMCFQYIQGKLMLLNMPPKESSEGE